MINHSDLIASLSPQINKKSFKKDLGQSLRRSAPEANGEEMATLPQRSTVGHWMMREAYSIRSLMACMGS
jgi:hypothetical protein